MDTSSLEEDLDKRMDTFRRLFCETLEKDYDDEKLNNIINDLDKISQNVRKYDEIIYNVSQKVTTIEKKTIKRKRRGSL